MPALGSVGVAAYGVHLGDHGYVSAAADALNRGAQAGQPGADYQQIVFVQFSSPVQSPFRR